MNRNERGSIFSYGTIAMATILLLVIGFYKFIYEPKNSKEEPVEPQVQSQVQEYPVVEEGEVLTDESFGVTPDTESTDEGFSVEPTPTPVPAPTPVPTPTPEPEQTDITRTTVHEKRRTLIKT